ncbi:hypothetical protein D9758_013766 [Tetrapyrgos nigripes]|uniref:Uncharacterized protein n=1 Tax=Tetrapyrgos nigripes TaxID=182062 RepID=A0A8H5D7G1_9AGAR|nr:hypothetical protein D9758_013766 [Tetrapyrgos nigripes]
MGVRPFDDSQSLIHSPCNPVSANATPPNSSPSSNSSSLPTNQSHPTSRPTQRFPRTIPIRPTPTPPHTRLSTMETIVEGSPGLWGDVVIYTTTMGAGAGAGC